MPNIDLLLESHLKTLVSGKLSKKTDEINLNIPFAHVGFIREPVWKNSPKYKGANNPRASHPGLSVSSRMSKVAFGTSKTDNRNPKNKNLFFVNKEDCSLLSKTTVFLLKTTIPANLMSIDYSQTDTARLSNKKTKELRSRGFK